MQHVYLKLPVKLILNHSVVNKKRSGQPRTAVAPQNEERLGQLICANRQITTRDLGTELKIGFSALETMVAMLEYRKVCAMRVPRMLTREHKEHCLQFISVINQLDAQNFCFTISLFHASTCFEHMC